MAKKSSKKATSNKRTRLNATSFSALLTKLIANGIEDAKDWQRAIMFAFAQYSTHRNADYFEKVLQAIVATPTLKISQKHFVAYICEHANVKHTIVENKLGNMQQTFKMCSSDAIVKVTKPKVNVFEWNKKEAVPKDLDALAAVAQLTKKISGKVESGNITDRKLAQAIIKELTAVTVAHAPKLKAVA